MCEYGENSCVFLHTDGQVFLQTDCYHTSHPPEAKLPLKGCWQSVFIKVTHNAGSPAAAMAALPHSQPCTGSLPQRKCALLERKIMQSPPGKAPAQAGALCRAGGHFPSAAQTSARLRALSCLSAGLTPLPPLFIFHFLLQL